MMPFHRHNLDEEDKTMIGTIRVSAGSNPVAVAAAIAHSLRDRRSVYVQAIGLAAVNQAMKATIVARNLLARDKLDLTLVPGFAKVYLGEEERTAVRLSVYAHATDEACKPLVEDYL
jgi:stage V sporulation protein S